MLTNLFISDGIEYRRHDCVDAFSNCRTPCKISFVRSRMFYAKAALNANGGIRFGMRHIRQWPSTQSAEYG